MRHRGATCQIKSHLSHRLLARRNTHNKLTFIHTMPSSCAIKHGPNSCQDKVNLVDETNFGWIWIYTSSDWSTTKPLLFRIRTVCMYSTCARRADGETGCLPGTGRQQAQGNPTVPAASTAGGVMVWLWGGICMGDSTDAAMISQSIETDRPHLA